MQLTYHRIETQHWLYRIMSLLALIIAFALPISISVYSIGLRVLVLFAFLVINIKDLGQQLYRNPLTWTLFSFLSVLVIWQFFSIDPAYGKVDLHRYSKFWCLPFVMPLFLHAKLRKQMVDVFILGVSFVVVMVYLKALGFVHFRIGYEPASGFATHIETSFAVALASYFTLLTIDWRKKTTYWRLALFAFLVAYLFGMNTGRMGYAVFLGLISLYCWQQLPRRYFLLAIAGLCLVVVGVYFLSPIFHRMVNLIFEGIRQTHAGNRNYASIGTRLTFWHASWQLFKEAPWFGHGTGSFKNIYDVSRFGMPSGNYTLDSIRSPDCDYWFVLVQFGVVGMLCYLSTFVAMFFMTRQLPRSERYFAEGILVAALLAQLFNSALYRSMIGTICVIFIAVFYAECLRQKETANDA